MKGERDNDRVFRANGRPFGVAPLFKLPVLTWIGNAAAALRGKHGDVSRPADAANCSRQTFYDPAAKVEKALTDAHSGGPSREQLLAEIALLRQENQELWNAYVDAIDFPKEKQQHFTTTAAAMGLSLCQILALL